MQLEELNTSLLYGWPWLLLPPARGSAQDDDGDDEGEGEEEEQEQQDNNQAVMHALCQVRWVWECVGGTVWVTLGPGTVLVIAMSHSEWVHS